MHSLTSANLDEASNKHQATSRNKHYAHQIYIRPKHQLPIVNIHPHLNKYKMYLLIIKSYSNYLLLKLCIMAAQCITSTFTEDQTLSVRAFVCIKHLYRYS